MDLYLKKITLQTAVTMMHGRLSEASIRGKLKAMAPNLVQDADRWQVLRSANSVADLVEKRRSGRSRAQRRSLQCRETCCESCAQVDWR